MYQALYRKYRPVTFEDVISQPHITTTLQNQIMNGKTAHAYLFTGSRGTGKTTCARIFAKALNCEHSVNGSPCNECDICRDADNFALTDIIEIDAASNGGVEDARELREAAEYTPERCRYKVYIIDEVHMLSKDAFNALLKIIEEPPPHVKFIMATTELHKVLPTILSRCQRFDFRRIRTEDIAARVKSVCEKEGVPIDEDAADLIAKTADGGMRDALSILDRCIAFSESITADVVSEASGIAGRGYLFSLMEAVSDKNSAAALDVISELYDRSKDMQRLCEELINQYRNVMIAISAPDKADLISCLPSELDRIKELAGKTKLEEVFRLLDMLSRCAERMSGSMSKRIDMEMCIIRMCSGMTASVSKQETSPAVDNKLAAQLFARITELEDRLKNGGYQQKQSPRSSNPALASRESVTDMSSVREGELVYIEKWQDIIDRLRQTCPSLAPALMGTYGYSQGGKLLINSRDTLIKALLRNPENMQRVLSAVEDIAGMKLNKALVGYRANLDRSPSANGENTEEHKASPEENMEALLKKAENGGVSVENL